jgi:hypothetical protein
MSVQSRRRRDGRDERKVVPDGRRRVRRQRLHPQVVFHTSDIKSTKTTLLDLTATSGTDPQYVDVSAKTYAYNVLFEYLSYP